MRNPSRGPTTPRTLRPGLATGDQKYCRSFLVHLHEFFKDGSDANRSQSQGGLIQHEKLGPGQLTENEQGVHRHGARAAGNHRVEIQLDDPGTSRKELSHRQEDSHQRLLIAGRYPAVAAE